VTTSIGNATSPATTASLGSYDDAMSALYTTISDLRQNDVAAGETGVEENETQQKQEETEQRAALQQEQSNQANSGGGFFSDVGHFFSDVASDVVHGRFGSAIDDAGRDLEDAWNSPHFWNDLKTDLEDVAIVATAVAATVTTAGVGGVAGAALTVGALAGAGAGLASARVEHFEANAEDASADATAAGSDIDELQQLTADVIAGVKQSDESQERALESLTQAFETHDETLVTAASTPVKG